MTQTTIQPTGKYKVAAIAELLKVDRKTVYNYMDSGILPFDFMRAKPGQVRKPRYCYGKVLINYINKYETTN